MTAGESGMEIAEFLLARIAEDEESVPQIDCPCGETPVVPLPHCGERVLAECEAKRRIVEEHSAPGEYTVCPAEGYRWDRCPTLLALALPYADHPDYQPAWSVQVSFGR